MNVREDSIHPKSQIVFAASFAAYVILTAISSDKTLRQSILLPAELASTSLDEKRVHDCRFFLNPIK